MNFNTGENLRLAPLDIGHKEYCAIVEPESAFWALVKKNHFSKTLFSKKFHNGLSAKIAEYKKEINDLRFNLKPSAVYFNPTDRCNLNCKYCYIPEDMRRDGIQMPFEKMNEAMEKIKDYFKKNLPANRKAQIVFHGAEPTVNKDVMFKIIEKYSQDFIFGIQSNGTLIENSDADFIKTHGVMIGLSLDGPDRGVSDKSRINWEGKGSFEKVEQTIAKFANYDGLSVICTMTDLNLNKLSDTIEYFHDKGVKTCLLNAVRCTQKAARTIKPSDAKLAKSFIKALEKSRKLYKKTGRKIVVANFANILLAILAPSGRKLMCDISPCGGGRCFFAVSASGDIFPCSEFIGVPEFCGGNIFKKSIEQILESNIFKEMTGRVAENITFCKDCAIRNFCGAPCPAEAYTMNGGLNQRGAFCEFYEEQTRFAFRLVADRIYEDFLPDNWDKDMIDFNFEF